MRLNENKCTKPDPFFKYLPQGLSWGFLWSSHRTGLFECLPPFGAGSEYCCNRV